MGLMQNNMGMNNNMQRPMMQNNMMPNNMAMNSQRPLMQTHNPGMMQNNTTMNNNMQRPMMQNNNMMQNNMRPMGLIQNNNAHRPGGPMVQNGQQGAVIQGGSVLG